MTSRSAVKVALLLLVTVGVVGGSRQAEAQFYGSLRWGGPQVVAPVTDLPPIPAYPNYPVIGSINYVPIQVSQPTAPPANMTPTLPPGVRQGVIDGQMYYYYQSTWYTPSYYEGSVQYTRVSPPYGAVVDTLPQGAGQTTVGGATYYTVDGIFYQPVYSEGALSYKIVPKPQGA